MGTNKLPPLREISLEEAQETRTINNGNQGYAYQIYEKLKEAHAKGLAIAVDFPTVSSSNKMVRNIAAHAQPEGFDLYSERKRLSSTRSFWLEKMSPERLIEFEAEVYEG